MFRHRAANILGQAAKPIGIIDVVEKTFP